MGLLHAGSYRPNDNLIPMTPSSTHYSPYSDWTSSIDKQYNFRTTKIFELPLEQGKRWIDLYIRTTTCPSPSPRGDSEAGEYRVDSYMGYCDVPTRRITDLADLSAVLEPYVHQQPTHTAPGNGSLFLIIRQYNSFSRLLTSRELFDAATQACFASRTGVLTHILPYGARNDYRFEEIDIGGPQSWYSPRSATKNSNEHCSSYECVYTLRSIEPNSSEDRIRPWIERKSTVMRGGLANAWVLISPSSQMQLALHTSSQQHEATHIQNDFFLHTLFIGAAMANWRPYLSYLTDETNRGVNRVIATDPEQLHASDLTIEDRQKFRLLEDRIADMFAMLDSTLDTITSLQEKYHLFHLNQASVEMAAVKTDTNAYAFHEKIRELHRIRKQLEALHLRVSSAVTMLSSLFDLGNGHSLRTLAEESRMEGAAMKHLTEKATQDASAVKVITIVTMFYLPVTVVASFFSTDFVSVSKNDGGSLYVSVAGNWWLIIAISVPLTVATFGIWWSVCHRAFYLAMLRKSSEQGDKVYQGLRGRLRQRRSVPISMNP